MNDPRYSAIEADANDTLDKGAHDAWEANELVAIVDDEAGVIGYAYGWENVPTFLAALNAPAPFVGVRFTRGDLDRMYGALVTLVRAHPEWTSYRDTLEKVRAALREQPDV